ncbi:hypothetical protein SeHB_A1738 [Salmonella enterica subsp. enterica serovar Heidelberg str. SL486]|nr:hypothetical protein SeHB_A1738 [Salmonella enterica subsp. enterica serovar Heidelberg str. SL486]
MADGNPAINFTRDIRKYILKYCTYDAGHRLAFFYSDRELF